MASVLTVPTTYYNQIEGLFSKQQTNAKKEVTLSYSHPSLSLCLPLGHSAPQSELSPCISGSVSEAGSRQHVCSSVRGSESQGSAGIVTEMPSASASLSLPDPVPSFMPASDVTWQPTL